MEGQDLTKGDIRKQLWSLAWPLMLSVFFYTLYNLVDTYWVSKISPEAIAAVSISQIVLFSMVALSMGVSVGSGVVMAMNIGAKKIKEARRILGQSFVLAAIAAVFFTAFSLIFSTQLLTMSGATGLIFQPAFDYFSITAAGSIFLFMLMAIVFAFNSQGDTFTLTKLFVVSTVINIILDPIMIFGWFGFPELGISGAAIATLISQAVFIGLALHSLSGAHRMVRFQFSDLSFKLNSVKQVLAIGVPASLTQVIYPIGLAALTFITALGFLEAGAVAFSLGFRIEFFAFLPAIGFGFAGVAMIGQNIGARKIDRARQSFKTALKYAFFASTGIGVLAVIFASGIIGVFTSDALVTEYANSYMWFVALSYGFLAATMVEASAFQAIGRPWPGFFIFLLRFFIISAPLAYVLTQVLGMGITGIWAAIAVGSVISSTIGYFWIRKEMKEIDVKKPLADTGHVIG